MAQGVQEQLERVGLGERLTRATWWHNSVSAHLFIAAFTVLALLWKLQRPVMELDEGILLVYPELIISGQIPNLDFASLYPPGNYWFLAAMFQIFGAGLLVERSVGVAYVLLMASALFYIARPRGLLIATMIACMPAVVLQAFPGPLAAYAWFAGAGFALWAVALGAEWSTRGCVDRLLEVSGLLGGIAILFRHDLVPALGLSALVTIGVRPARLLRYTVAALVGASPLFVHLIGAGLGPVVENLVWDVLRAGPTRRLPLDLANPMLWGVGLSCVIPASCMIWSAWARRGSGSRWQGASVAVFALGVLPQMLQRADRWHLAYVGCFTVPLACNALVQLVERQRPATRAASAQRALNRVCVVAGFVVALGVFLPSLMFVTWDGFGPLFTARSSCSHCVISQARSLPVRDPTQLQHVVDVLDASSRPGDTLFVGPHDLSRTNYNDTYLYFLFPKLKANSYWIEMASAISNRPASRLGADLAASKFVLLTSAYDNWKEQNALVFQGSEEPNAILARDFCLVAENRPYELYRHRENDEACAPVLRD